MSLSRGEKIKKLGIRDANSTILLQASRTSGGSLWENIASIGTTIMQANINSERNLMRQPNAHIRGQNRSGGH